MSNPAQPGLFSTLRPLGLPPTPILSLILTYGINVVATPRQYYGPLLGKNNDDPANNLARAETEKGAVSHEQRVKIIRAKAAAANLQECMPLFVTASLVSWLGGVKPEYQNLYHVWWFLSRVAYKWAYLNGNGNARAASFLLSQISTMVMLIYGGNRLAATSFPLI